MTTTCSLWAYDRAPAGIKDVAARPANLERQATLRLLLHSWYREQHPGPGQFTGPHSGASLPVVTVNG